MSAKVGVVVGTVSPSSSADRAPSHSSAVAIAADSAAGRCALAQGARAKFERTMTKIAARGGGGGDNGAVSSSGEMAAVRAPS